MRNWQKYAKCAGDDDPERYHFEDGDRGVVERAAVLCEGCPVMAECLKDAFREINITKILESAGLKPRDPEEDVVYQLGAIRGGIPV